MKNRKIGKNKQLVLNVTSQFISFLVSIGVSFVITPYITDKLGKDVYGFVGLAYQVTSYISAFTVAFNAMLNIFLATEYHKNNIGKAQVLYNSVLKADVFLSVILILPLSIIVRYLELILDVPIEAMQDIKFLWALIFITFLISLATGPFTAATYITNRVDLNAKRTIESNVLRGAILAIAYFSFAPKVWYVGFAALITGIYLAISNYRYIKQLTPELKIHKNHFSIIAVKELISVGIWSTVNEFTTILMNGLDLVISNIFIGSLSMGYISYAQTVPNQIAVLLTTLNNAFSPSLTRTYAKGNQEEFRKEVISAIKICGFLGSIPILGFIAFGTSFYQLWLPTLTTEEVIKINFLSILILFPMVFNVYISPLYTINSITKHIKIPVIVTLVLGILNVVLELILLETTNLEIYAIEIVTAILMFGRVFLFTPIYAACNLKWKWYTFYKPLFRGVIANIVVLICFLIIRNSVKIDTWLSLCLVCASAGILGYIINYFIILDQPEKTAIKNKINSKLHKTKMQS